MNSEQTWAATFAFIISAMIAGVSIGTTISWRYTNESYGNYLNTVNKINERSPGSVINILSLQQFYVGQ
jgi:hypothetical protein